MITEALLILILLCILFMVWYLKRSDMYMQIMVHNSERQFLEGIKAHVISATERIEKPIELPIGNPSTEQTKEEAEAEEEDLLRIFDDLPGVVEDEGRD